MEKKQSSQKVKSFLKRNVYYIIMAICLLAIASMVTVTVVLNDEEKTVDNSLNNTLGEDNSQVSDISDKKDVTPTTEEPTSKEDTKTSTDDTTTTMGDKTDEQPTGKEQETIGDDSQKETPTSDPISFIAPVETVDVIKEYAMDSLVWNSTLRHYAVHNGIDFGGEDGTKVLCVCDGVITAVEYDILNGYTVTVQHNDTLSTCYGSLNEPSVKVGQMIKKGDQIGTMGTTAGNEYSMGPHLHFSVIENKKYTDPYQYMTIGGK